MINRDKHYCKHCDTDFIVSLHEDETGDFFLECPECGWKHYRHFSKGVAVHCELKDRLNEPLVIKGKK